MTQAAMNEYDEKIKDETTKIVGDLVNRNVINFPSMYK
jgi:hypothetical protein